METIWENIFQLGGTVTTTAIFVWYLNIRNGKQERAMKEVTDALYVVHKAQERHTRVLINVAKNHHLAGDADNLMTE